MADLESKLLAQSRLTTVATTIYTPPALTIGVIKQLIITNTSTTNTTYRLYFDMDGAVYDEDSSLFWDVTLGGNSYDLIPVWAPTIPGSNVGVEASANDRITATIGGYEVVQDNVFAERPLGQIRPPTITTPVSLFSPAFGLRGVVRNLVISNVAPGGKSAIYSIYLDHDGTTYDDTTALARNISLSPGATDTLILWLPMEDSAGNLAVETVDGGGELNFTAFGFLERL